MRRKTSIVIIAALLLLPMVSGARSLPTGPTTFQTDRPIVEIDLRIRLDGLDSAWNGRIALDGLERNRSSVFLAEGMVERGGVQGAIRAEMDEARRWFLVMRALGRFTIRQLVHLIGFPLLG